jgi:Lipopolysaccharide-assembly
VTGAQPLVWRLARLIWGSGVIVGITALFAGCLGYTLGPIKPTFMKEAGISTISVPIFDNRSYQPQIEALVTTSVIQAVQNDGTYQVTSEDRADAIVRGTILGVDRFQARSVVGNVLASAEFVLQLRLRIQVFSTKTNTLIATRDVVGQTSFFAGPDIPTQQSQAVPIAAQDAARQAVVYLAEGW